MAGDELPAGYVRVGGTSGRVGEWASGSEIVATIEDAPAVGAALEVAGTLYDYARNHRHAAPLIGRGVAYAVPLPSQTARVVVRHNRHGGALARFTRDLFLGPTRAPYELLVSERLRAAGIPTPRLIAYMTYPAFGVWRRADVATREVVNGFDLSAAISSSDAGVRVGALDAAVTLVVGLSKAGARHHDLNIKNVLLHRDRAGTLAAMVLDVDRVVFDGSTPDELLERNMARLLRSATKWTFHPGARVTEPELDRLRRATIRPS